jgi:hypothetical protein
MRPLFQFLFATLLSTSLLAQSDNSKSHYLKNPTVFTPVDITKIYTKYGLIQGNRLTLDTVNKIQELKIQESDSSKTSIAKIKIIDTVFKCPITIESGYAYNIIQEIGTFTIIKFWPIKENKAVGLLQSFKINKEDNSKKMDVSLCDTLKSLKIDGLRLKTIDSSKTAFDLTQSYYIVKTAVLKSNSVEFENKKGLWNIGLLVLPVKVRPFATKSGQFDFADGFSVGTTFSWTVHHNWKTNFTHNFLLYVGISSYTADSSKLNEQRNDYKIATFSPAIGWMWEKNNVQLSILAGIDFPSGNLQQKWVYKNMPWIGVGVGIGLFKIGNEKNTGHQANK